MGNLNETEKWEENIYQLETSDPVLGGADGISNRAPRQLANRTKWLKKKTEEEKEFASSSTSESSNLSLCG